MGRALHLRSLAVPSACTQLTLKWRGPSVIHAAHSGGDNRRFSDRGECSLYGCRTIRGVVPFCTGRRRVRF
jgi:hypothetical protein